MDRIEFEPATQSTCACCGDITTHLVRFVSRDEAAFAVYFADFSEGHDFVSVLVGLGEWSEESTPVDRVAFALRIWTAENSYQVGLVDAVDTMYATSYLGRILDRDEALAHPLKSEVFALSDHIVACDEPVIAFLNREAAA